MVINNCKWPFLPTNICLLPVFIAFGPNNFQIQLILMLEKCPFRNYLARSIELKSIERVNVCSFELQQHGLKLIILFFYQLDLIYVGAASLSLIGLIAFYTISMLT